MKITQTFWNAKTALIMFSVAILLAGGAVAVRGQISVSAISVELSTPTPTPGCTDDTWTATSTIAAPISRAQHAAVWTGTEMIVWGGWDGGHGFPNTGGRYNPTTDTWIATSSDNAPSGRANSTAVWTGNEMIVWGGADGNGYVNTGGRYNPATNSWTATTTINAPTARDSHSAVWTGAEMIVWGGTSGSLQNTGGRYDPATDSWIRTSQVNSPAARFYHTAIWTGGEMMTWGGWDGGPNFLNTGGRYNPTTDIWIATSTDNAPTGRGFLSAVWTGREMIVWSGQGAFMGTAADYSNTGGRYNPCTNSWTATSTDNAPTGRAVMSAVWTGREMIVWGGYLRDGIENLFVKTGGRYNPTSDSWLATSSVSPPDDRAYHTAVWTGSEMIVWGGVNNSGVFDTGGRYCAPPSPTPIPTPTATPVGARGSFIIGDLDAIVGHAVYFWGSQWSSHNHLSQGPASSAFKGFANSIGNSTPICGGMWSSDPGNSAGPPNSVPDFITVIASSSVTKSGQVITGNNRKIVVVRADPGYNGNPSHPGTGTVVSVTCQ